MINVPDLHADLRLTDLSRIASGLGREVVDIDGGDWAITFSNGRLAVDLVGSAGFDVNAADNSAMTVTDFDIGINGNGTGQTFSGTVTGNTRCAARSATATSARSIRASFTRRLKRSRLMPSSDSPCRRRYRSRRSPDRPPGLCTQTR